MRRFPGFVGITDVEFAHAEGLGQRDESRTAALNAAEARISQLAA